MQSALERAKSSKASRDIVKSDALTAGSTLVQGGKAGRARGYAAEICEDVGFELSKGALKCSKATAKRQKVRERW
jgi:hypothetical protein